jgi:hypothetical protein
MHLRLVFASIPSHEMTFRSRSVRAKIGHPGSLAAFPRTFNLSVINFLFPYHHHPPFLGPPSLRPLPHFLFFSRTFWLFQLQPALFGPVLPAGSLWGPLVQQGTGCRPPVRIARVCCPLHVPGLVRENGP